MGRPRPTAISRRCAGGLKATAFLPEDTPKLERMAKTHSSDPDEGMHDQSPGARAADAEAQPGKLRANPTEQEKADSGAQTDAGRGSHYAQILGETAPKISSASSSASTERQEPERDTLRSGCGPGPVSGASSGPQVLIFGDDEFRGPKPVSSAETSKPVGGEKKTENRPKREEKVRSEPTKPVVRRKDQKHAKPVTPAESTTPHENPGRRASTEVPRADRRQPVTAPRKCSKQSSASKRPSRATAQALLRGIKAALGQERLETWVPAEVKRGIEVEAVRKGCSAQAIVAEILAERFGKGSEESPALTWSDK